MKPLPGIDEALKTGSNVRMYFAHPLVQLPEDKRFVTELYHPTTRVNAVKNKLQNIHEKNFDNAFFWRQVELDNTNEYLANTPDASLYLASSSILQNTRLATNNLQQKTPSLMTNILSQGVQVHAEYAVNTVFVFTGSGFIAQAPRFHQAYKQLTDKIRQSTNL